MYKLHCNQWNNVTFCTDFTEALSYLQIVTVWLNTYRFKNAVNTDWFVPQNNSAICSINSGRCLAFLAGFSSM